MCSNGSTGTGTSSTERPIFGSRAITFNILIMDLTTSKACIISCGIGGHYRVGIDRLARSLNFVGWGGHTMFWKDYPEGCPKHEGAGQYNFKLHAFEAAFAAGYTVVLWADSSIYAVQNPMPVFDYINEHGLYFFKTGYSLAQTATDALLQGARTTRDEVMNVSEFATGLVGINIENPKGKEFFKRWRYAMHWGLFNGNRVHDKSDSEDPRFLFSRQDQSAASMALHKMNVKTAGEDRDWTAYFSTKCNPERVIFFIQGL
jgi:hypothetical protein